MHLTQKKANFWDGHTPGGPRGKTQYGLIKNKPASLSGRTYAAGRCLHILITAMCLDNLCAHCSLTSEVVTKGCHHFKGLLQKFRGRTIFWVPLSQCWTSEVFIVQSGWVIGFLVLCGVLKDASAWRPPSAACWLYSVYLQYFVYRTFSQRDFLYLALFILFIWSLHWCSGNQVLFVCVTHDWW